MPQQVHCIGEVAVLDGQGILGGACLGIVVSYVGGIALDRGRIRQDKRRSETVCTFRSHRQIIPVAEVSPL